MLMFALPVILSVIGCAQNQNDEVDAPSPAMEHRTTPTDRNRIKKDSAMDKLFMAAVNSVGEEYLAAEQKLRAEGADAIEAIKPDLEDGDPTAPLLAEVLKRWIGQDPPEYQAALNTQRFLIAPVQASDLGNIIRVNDQIHHAIEFVSFQAYRCIEVCLDGIPERVRILIGRIFLEKRPQKVISKLDRIHRMNRLEGCGIEEDLPAGIMPVILTSQLSHYLAPFHPTGASIARQNVTCYLRPQPFCCWAQLSSFV